MKTAASFVFGVDMEGVQLACFQVEAQIERAGQRAGPTRNHLVVLERPLEFTNSSLRQNAPSRIIADCPLLLLFECKQGSSSKHQCAIPLSDITELHTKYLLKGQGRVTTKGLIIIVTSDNSEELVKLFKFISDMLENKSSNGAICCGRCRSAEMSRQAKKRSREDGEGNDENVAKLLKTEVRMEQTGETVEGKGRYNEEVPHAEMDREVAAGKMEEEATERIASMTGEEERKKTEAEVGARNASMKEEEEREEWEAEAQAHTVALEEEEEESERREAEARARIASVKEEEERKWREAEASARIASLKGEEEGKKKMARVPARKEEARHKQEEEGRRQRQVDEEIKLKSPNSGRAATTNCCSSEDKKAANIAASKEKAQDQEELKRWKEEQREELKRWKEELTTKAAETMKDAEYMRQWREATRLPQIYAIPDEIQGWNHAQYEDCWAQLRSASHEGPLKFPDIPWPPVGNPLFLLRGDTPQVQKQKLKTALLRWHPDKFRISCGKRLFDMERDMILALVDQVFQSIMVWKAWLFQGVGTEKSA